MHAALENSTYPAENIVWCYARHAQANTRDAGLGANAFGAHAHSAFAVAETVRLTKRAFKTGSSLPEQHESPAARYALQRSTLQCMRMQRTLVFSTV